jgi:ABC-2 type transport system ATP-binding protein
MKNQTDTVMIEAENLTKVFGTFPAVQSISFTCQKGEIVGFLGPNGAGKTTTMRMLSGYLPPTAGAAYIAGYNTMENSIEARQNLGYLPETVPLYTEMTVENYLAYVGKLRRVDNLWERVDSALQSVDMIDRAESYIGKLSKGMRQRVGLAQALMHDPPVLILDEPTIGLDPAQIKEVRQLIIDLGKKHTILLSTHILSEVEQICTRAIMIINGRIWADMPLRQDGASGNRLTLRLAAPAEDAARTLARVPGVQQASQDSAQLFSLDFDGRDETRSRVAAAAVQAGWGLLELTASKTSLETIFLDKMQEAEAASQTAIELEEEEEVEMSNPDSQLPTPESQMADSEGEMVHTESEEEEEETNA